MPGCDPGGACVSRLVGRRVPRLCVPALIVTLLAVSAAPISWAWAVEEERAILRLTLNGVERGDVRVVLRGTDVLVRIADLERVGLRNLAGQRKPIEQDMYVSLTSLAPGVAFTVDERALALQLTAQPVYLVPTVQDFLPGRPAGLVYSQDTAAFLNSSVSGIDFNRFTWTGEAGLSIKNTLLFTSASRDDQGTLARGLSNFTVDDRAHMIRWLAGDRFDTTGALGGTAQIGGFSISREFSLDPYFIRFPTVGLSGAVLSRTTAEVYVNGQLVRSQELPPGPFELRNLPVPIGTGTAQIVLRDAFGRVQQITSPFYFTSAVLKAGVQEFSYDVGFPRDLTAPGLGQYGPWNLLARHRVGVTDDLSAGLRLELASGLVSGGPVVTFRLPVGDAELSAAGSQGQDRGGWAASLGYNYASRPLSFGFSARTFSDDYRNISLKPAADRPKLDVTALVGFPLTSRSTVTLQYTHTDFRDMGPQQRVSASVSLRLTNRANMFVTASRSEQKGLPTSLEVFSGITYFLGDRTTATVSNDYSHQQNGASQNTTAFEAQRSLPLGSGFGYRVQANRTEQNTPPTPGGPTESSTEQYGGLARLQYQAGYGFYEASYQRSAGKDSTFLTAAAGLVAIGGSLHVSRPVQDAFALIRVPDVPGVRGYLSNQEVGRTDSSGNLLVPNLLPYFGNRIGIAAEDVPLEYTLAATEQLVGPPVRGGAVVSFPARRIQGLVGNLLIDRQGQALIPAYGELTVTAEGQPYSSPIGRDGEIYLENVPAGRHSGLIEHRDTTCRFTLDVPVSAASLVDLGAIRCSVP